MFVYKFTEKMGISKLKYLMLCTKKLWCKKLNILKVIVITHFIRAGS